MLFPGLRPTMGAGGGVRAFEKRKESVALRFGPFELDLKSSELRKSGVLIKVQHQPLKVLALLASRPGDLLTREEIQHEVWPDGVFVDFEQSLNFCIRHIRGVLNDSAVVPRYIETLPKRGYRWIAPVEVVREEAVLRPVLLSRPASDPSAPTLAQERTQEEKARRWPLGLAASLFAVTLLGAGALLLVRHEAKVPAFHRLTYRRGSISSGRFTPDGQIIFAAAWEGQPTALFTASAANGSWRRLDVSGRRVVSSLRSGEFSFLEKSTLSRAPLSGGPPKPIADGIVDADGSLDGSNFVVVRGMSSRTHIEWPLGHVLADASWPTHLRLSPRGDRIAFLEHPTPGDDRGSVVTIDRGGQRTELSSDWGSLEGLAWSPKGDEVWFTAARTGADCSLWAVSLSRHERLVLSTMGRLVIEDITPDGRVLLQRQTMRGETRVGRAGEAEKDLSWLDLSTLADLSPDGGSIVFGESGEGGGPDYEIYLRKTDGSTPIRLGHGQAMALSPDGKWVISVPIKKPDQLDLLPTGPGEGRTLKDSHIEQYFLASWFPDGQSLLVNGFSHGKGRAYIQPLVGPARPVTPEGTFALMGGVSPDGKTFLAYVEKLLIFPVGGGEPRTPPGKGGTLIGWKDPGTIYVSGEKAPSARVEELNLASGHREFVRELVPPDMAGVLALTRIRMTPDGKTWAYSYARVLADLYIVDNLLER
jgi:DNA-binding winged helix-turn-helix (wHTH) protein